MSKLMLIGKAVKYASSKKSYTFTVADVTTAPQAGAIYADGDNRYLVYADVADVDVSPDAIVMILIDGIYNAPTSLTKVSGTGDTTLTVNSIAEAFTTANYAVFPDSLADGAIGIYARDKSDERTKLVVPQGTSVDSGLANFIITVDDADLDATSIYIAQGTTDGAIVSDKLSTSDVEKFIGSEYAAETKMVKTITPTMPSTTTVYDEYIVKVHDILDPNKEVVSYVVQGKYANATAAVTAMKARINADPNAKVVASGTSTLLS